VGAATGALEALVLWTKQAIFGQVVFVSRHVLWMTPLLYVLLCSLIGLVVVAASWALPKRWGVPAVVFATVTFGVVCLLLPVGQIHRIAAGILALGVGMQAARFVHAKPEAALRGLRGAVLVLTVVSLAAGGVGELRFRTDSSGFAGPVDAANERTPNVLIVVWDTVRSASLSLYGHLRATTPQLERLAAQSVVFDEAYSTSPWTLPGHASLFTGQYPHDVSASWYARLDDADVTLSEIFREAGHATGGFVANHHYTSYDSGLARGFDVYRDYRVSWDQFLRSSAFTQTPSGEGIVRARSLGDFWNALRAFNWWVGVKRDSDRKHSDELNAQFLDWVDSLGEQPFFGFLNYFDAHAGYWAPPEFLARFPDSAEGAYEAAIAYQDDRLGILLAELEERGMLDNTIVVLTSDHGELFGEHDLYGHAHNLYRPTIHIPLMVRFPAAAPSGVRVAAGVTLRDVPATILELAGLALTSPLPGSSLSRMWHQQAPLEPVLAEVEMGRNNAPSEPISRGPVRSVLREGWQYILNGDGVEELYYHREGDADMDLFHLPEHQGRVDELRTHLERMVPDAQAPSDPR